MGELFSQCNPKREYSTFSAQVPGITRQAIIDAVEGMCAEMYRNGQELFPALPLISGGDDVFMLMPAPWAVDVAMRYCASYEVEMSKAVVTSIDALRGSGYRATTGVAVVICKASYPYRVAHQHVHGLLNAAKNRAKDIGHSCLIVDFIVGSDTVSGASTPPLVLKQADARYLLDYRHKLTALPKRTLHQLEEARLEGRNLDSIIKRTRDLYPDFDYAGDLTAASAQPQQFREVLKLWDFCFDMQYRRESYLTEGR